MVDMLVAHAVMVVSNITRSSIAARVTVRVVALLAVRASVPAATENNLLFG
jgi:hypothetical protein